MTASGKLVLPKRRGRRPQSNDFCAQVAVQTGSLNEGEGVDFDASRKCQSVAEPSLTTFVPAAISASTRTSVPTPGSNPAGFATDRIGDVAGHVDRERDALIGVE